MSLKMLVQVTLLLKEFGASLESSLKLEIFVKVLSVDVSIFQVTQNIRFQVS